MTAPLIENAVTLADLAKAAKITAVALDAELVALAVFVGADWAGRPAVSVVDAHAVTSGAARRQLEHDRRWHEHRLEAEGWEQDRDRAVRAAASAASDAALRRGDGVPQAQEAGQEAAIEAGQRFERERPMPMIDGLSVATLRFAPAPGVLRRVAERLTGASA